MESAPTGCGKPGIRAGKPRPYGNGLGFLSPAGAHRYVRPPGRGRDTVIPVGNDLCVVPPCRGLSSFARNGTEAVPYGRIHETAAVGADIIRPPMRLRSAILSVTLRAGLASRRDKPSDSARKHPGLAPLLGFRASAPVLSRLRACAPRFSLSRCALGSLHGGISPPTPPGNIRGLRPSLVSGHPLRSYPACEPALRDSLRSRTAPGPSW